MAPTSAIARPSFDGRRNCWGSTATSCGAPASGAPGLGTTRAAGFRQRGAHGLLLAWPAELLGLIHESKHRWDGTGLRRLRRAQNHRHRYHALRERIVTQEELIIPHPGMRERKFVLLPLIELDAGLKDPVSGRLFLEYLAQLPPQGIYPLGQGIYDAPCP